ncbi:MAG: hypothetical protein LQ338_003834 [Usnochroma carphineum]|nr:MAG: hypothetical protein LQ338_003834 [Usnochroma carphineum]
MDDSLPVPSAASQELHNFGAHQLQAVKSKDILSTRPPRSTGLRPTPEQAKAFAQKLLGRLPPAFCRRFFDTLEQTVSGKCASDKPHVYMSNMFAAADEPELWQEYLDLFMPHWKGKQKIEESEMELFEMMLENRPPIGFDEVQ